MLNLKKEKRLSEKEKIKEKGVSSFAEYVPAPYENCCGNFQETHTGICSEYRLCELVFKLLAHTYRGMNKTTLNKLAVILLAEGTVRRTKKGYSIVFTNTSDILQKIFSEFMRKLNQKVHKKSNKQYVVYSNKLGEELLKMCKSYRTKPCASGKQNACPVTRNKIDVGPSCKACKPIIFEKVKYPPASFSEDILNSNAKEIIEYLRLFCSCEGGPVIGKDIRNDEVIVRVGHPILRNQIIKMFDKIGIKVRVRGISLLYIRKRSEIKKFYEKIGFVDGVKTVRGTHKGVEKNKLVKFIINRHNSVQTACQTMRMDFW